MPVEPAQDEVEQVIHGRLCRGDCLPPAAWVFGNQFVGIVALRKGGDAQLERRLRCFSDRRRTARLRLVHGHDGAHSRLRRCPSPSRIGIQCQHGTQRRRVAIALAAQQCELPPGDRGAEAGDDVAESVLVCS